jgi:hypothetical protein
LLHPSTRLRFSQLEFEVTPFGVKSLLLWAFVFFTAGHVAAKETVFVPMRDGVKLATEVQKPVARKGPNRMGAELRRGNRCGVREMAKR